MMEAAWICEGYCFHSEISFVRLTGTRASDDPPSLGYAE